jgi:hypothetical protein
VVSYKSRDKFIVVPMGEEGEAVDRRFRALNCQRIFDSRHLVHSPYSRAAAVDARLAQ